MEQEAPQQNFPEQDLPDIPEPAPAPREHVAPDYHKQSHKLRNLAILVVILLLAGGGAYAYLKHNKSQKDAKAAAQAAQAAKSNAGSQIAATTKTYTSPNFYLTFSYPANWTVTDTGGGQMSAVSPSTQLKNAQGGTVTGQISLLIRKNTEKLSEFTAGNATALIDSQKIAYTKPTQNQRANTYLSFLQYASTAGRGLDGIYITGDNGYQKAQAIPLVDVNKADPIISITFGKCADSGCSGKTTPLTVDSTSWSDASFSGPLKTMLESLSIT